MTLSALTFALSGCTLPPTIASESPLGVTPRKFESVVVVLDPGFLVDLRTSGRTPVEYLGDVVEQELKRRDLQTSVVLSPLPYLYRSTFRKTVLRRQPTHIVTIVPSSRVTPANADRVRWMLQVNQKDLGNGEYKPGFRFTINGDRCVKGPTKPLLEDELRCFRELSTSIFSALDRRGFQGQAVNATTESQTFPSDENYFDFVQGAIENEQAPWFQKEQRASPEK